MSLNADQRARTNAELQANLTLSGLTESEVCTDLAFSPTRLAHALAVTGDTDPVDVWQLRDYVEQAVRDLDREPVPFTELTAQARLAAQGWFRLRPAPQRGSHRASPQTVPPHPDSSREAH